MKNVNFNRFLSLCVDYSAEWSVTFASRFALIKTFSKRWTINSLEQELTNFPSASLSWTVTLVLYASRGFWTGRNTHPTM